MAGSRFVAVSDQRGASRLLVLAQHRRVVGLERRELLALALRVLEQNGDVVLKVFDVFDVFFIMVVVTNFNMG